MSSHRLSQADRAAGGPRTRDGQALPKHDLKSKIHNLEEQVKEEVSVNRKLRLVSQSGGHWVLVLWMVNGGTD